jgi:Fur family ferric uptake transcriptional regulator
MKPGHRERAEALVRDSATRATRQRIEVLAVLLAAPRALSHLEVGRQLRRSLGMNRVTIYRVLDWLVARGLAHRIPGDDRVWRFNAAEGEHARRRHAHFKCSDCGGVICLEAALAEPKVSLPAGYRPQEVELTVKGVCAACTRSR